MNSNNSNSSSGHLSSPEPEGLSTNHVSRIDKWKAKHAAMTINEIVVVHGSTETIHSTRPQPDHEYCAQWQG